MKHGKSLHRFKKHGRAGAVLCGLAAALLPAAARADLMTPPEPQEFIGSDPGVLLKFCLLVLVIIVAAVALYVILRKKKRG